jgi:hypothetical protein
MARRLTAWTALACAWISPAPGCCMASGCDVSGAGVTPMISSPAPTTPSTRSAPERSPSGRASSCGRPEDTPRTALWLRGRAFALVEAAYLGEERAGADLIGPLRALGPELDTFAMVPAPALQQLHMDPPQPVPAEGDGEFLADLPAAAIDALLDLAGPGTDTPLTSIEIRHLGGALSRPAPGGGAQPSIDAGYLMFAGGFTPTPELDAAVRGQAQAVKEALAPWHASYDYYNFVETPAPASAVLPPASYQRLQALKASYDPDQVLISAHPIWPARLDT